MVMSYELDDPATADAWRSRALVSGLNKLAAGAWLLSMERKYPESLNAFASIAEQYPDEDYLIRTAAQIALVVGQPARAANWMVKLRPELDRVDAQVTLLNCESALILASAWQRMQRQADAKRLLQGVAAWIDGPDSPRGPEMQVARAQVHALLGEKEQALKRLDRAFDEGFRGVLATVISGYGYPGEDNPMLASIRGDPRFVAWFERLHADNVRQLALEK